MLQHELTSIPSVEQLPSKAVQLVTNDQVFVSLSKADVIDAPILPSVAVGASKS